MNGKCSNGFCFCLIKPRGGIIKIFHTLSTTLIRGRFDLIRDQLQRLFFSSSEPLCGGTFSKNRYSPTPKHRTGPKYVSPFVIQHVRQEFVFCDHSQLLRLCNISEVVSMHRSSFINGHRPHCWSLWIT